MATKVLSNQRVTVVAGLSSAISNWLTPTLAELTALTNVSGAVNWDSFDLNIQASEQSDDRTLTDGAGSQSRGFTNFGGGLQFVTPQPTDTASIFRLAYNLFSTPRVELVVAVRYGKLNSTVPAAGDKWTIYRVMTDATAFGQNDVSKHYSVNLIARDDILPGYIVPPSSPVAITTAVVSAAGSVGGLIFASAAYQGWDITKSATWVSSDEAKLIQVHPGIFRNVAAGTPTIKAQYAGGTDSTPATITIT
jgi:hypothetical protein